MESAPPPERKGIDVMLDAVSRLAAVQSEAQVVSLLEIPFNRVPARTVFLNDLSRRHQTKFWTVWAYVER